MFSKKKVILSLIIIALLFTLEAEESYKDILIKVDSYRDYNPKGYSLTFKTIEDGETTILKVYSKGSDKALIKYLEPEDLKDQFVLKSGKSYWLIESGMNAPIRLSPRTMLFGTASSGDITSTIFNRQYTVQSIETSGENKLIKLKAIPKTGANYKSIELLVNGGDYRPISSKCFSRAGVQLKTVFYTVYSNIGGKEILTSLEIKDDVNSKSSLVEMYDFQDNILPTRHYNRDFMKNLKPENRG